MLEAFAESKAAATAEAYQFLKVVAAAALDREITTRPAAFILLTVEDYPSVFSNLYPQREVTVHGDDYYLWEHGGLVYTNAGQKRAIRWLLNI